MFDQLAPGIQPLQTKYKGLVTKPLRSLVIHMYCSFFFKIKIKVTGAADSIFNYNNWVSKEGWTTLTREC